MVLLLTQPYYQRVALLEVWKTFEDQHGSPDDAAKVEAMKPIISKRRRVDQENGQMVEGDFLTTPLSFGC